MAEHLNRNLSVTLHDVAERAGVSASTASLVVRGSDRTSAKTRATVLQAISELGYVYNRAASNLRSQSSHTVGIVVGEITNPFYAELIAGVEGVMNEAGRLSFLANTGESLEKQDRFIRQIREQGVDGILLCPVERTSTRLIASLREWGLPCVQALRYCSNDSADYVGPDYRLGMELATEHLIARGHRNITYLMGERNTSAVRERLSGFQAAMTRHGLLATSLIRCQPTRNEGSRIIQKLLATESPPSAVLCYNDVLAFGVLAGIHQSGMLPGRDLAVVGFDNIAECAESWIGLTTVAVDPHGIGVAAAKLLLQRISNPSARPEQIIIPPRLIVRET
jgi:LacI family transcriptional regulator